MTSPRSSRILMVVAFTGLAFFATLSARATTIDFDTGSIGAGVGTTYSGLGVEFVNATFTGNASLPGGSGTKGIIASDNGTIVNNYQWVQDHAVIALFAGGASSVGITGLDVGSNGLRIDAFDSLVGGSLLDYDEVIGPGAGVGYFFNLSTTSAAIMRVEIYQLLPTPGDGIILDNFTFEASTSVPEHGSTFALLGLALLSFGALRRKLA